MEKLRVPFPLLLPKPVFIIVDQYEELLKNQSGSRDSFFGAVQLYELHTNYIREIMYTCALYCIATPHKFEADPLFLER